MAQKIKITQEDFLKIKQMYLDKKMTTKQMAKVLPYSETFIVETLKRNNIYINTKYICKDGFKKSDLKKEIIKLKNNLLSKDFVSIDDTKNEKKFIAICKKTGKIFNDYRNSSGILTEHLKNIYPDLIHPTNFLKREYKKTNNKYWHEIYFYIKENETQEKDKIKCKYCEWETYDIENKSGCYTNHIIKNHNISIDSHLKNFPEDNQLFKTQIKIFNEKNALNSSKDNYIECCICGEKLKYLNNSHLKRHNISITDYKLKYGKNKTLSNSYFKKLQNNYENNLKFCSNTFTSNAQTKIKNFLEINEIKCCLNNKKLLSGIEIDILSNDLKVGIEYNGIFYHTENSGNKKRNYHINKTELMNKKGYSLIHIFEDEWELKNEIVKSKLKHIFNKSDAVKIHARKCQIKEVDSNVKNIFLNNNHIQGEDRSNIHIGAFYSNKLVAIMTFDNNRQMNGRNNIKTYELKRFCIDINYVVVGIAGKLLSYFIKNYNPNKIISFADRRWTLNKDNNLYTKLGFKLTKILPPDYTYYNSKISKLKRFHKFSFGKSSLRKKFPEIYNKDKTEWEMMQEIGYDRIWDCGKFKYELNLTL